MEFDRNHLQEKLDFYFDKKLTKNELGNWANRAYYDLLKGGYLENKKIILYPFLKTISKIHIQENEKEDQYPCSEESVKKIQDILYGKIDFDFEIELSLPAEIDTIFKEKVYYDKKKYDIFLKFRDSMADYLKGECEYCFQSYWYSKDRIADYFEKKCAANKEIRSYFEQLISFSFPKKTVQDLLEDSIFRCYKILFFNNFLEGEGGVNFKLFAKKTEPNCKIAEQLFLYLDSYIGNRNFHLLISYRSGVADILLIAG